MQWMISSMEMKAIGRHFAPFIRSFYSKFCDQPTPVIIKNHRLFRFKGVSPANDAVPREFSSDIFFMGLS